MVIYLTNMEDHPRVEEKCQNYYRIHAPKFIDDPPAQTVICIPPLHEPDLLVEIDATAIKGMDYRFDRYDDGLAAFRVQCVLWAKNSTR